MENEDIQNSLMREIKKLKDDLKVHSNQVNVAMQGLDIVNSMGDSMVKLVAQKTIDEMGTYENKDSSQDNKVE